MLVSHTHRFIFAKTAKTASTSVEAYFEPFCMPPGEWRGSQLRDETVSAAGIVGFRGRTPPPGCRWWNHMPAALVREQLGEDVWRRYFRFCVVRNPYDRTLSHFYHLRRRGHAAVDLDAPDAEQFEQWIGTTTLRHDRAIYTIDDRSDMDFHVRYEHLARDLETVCRRLGVAWEPARLASYKAGHRPADATPQRMYTARSRALVAQAYAFELEHFGYGFPEETQ